MNFTLNQLRIFLKVIQTNSITRAAEELCLTQPAVSIQLKNLQEQFEIPLIEIAGKKLFVTEFGKEIASAAERMLNEMQNIGLRTKAYKGHLAGNLRIASVSTGKYVMPYLLEEFLHQNENITIQIDVTSKAQVIKRLNERDVDFALFSILPKRSDLEFLELLPNKLYFVGCACKSLPSKVIDRTSFASLPIICREKGSASRQLLDAYAEKNNITINKRLEFTSNEAVKQAVLAGLGYALLPLIAIHQELTYKTLHIVPVKGFPIKNNWYLVWLKEKQFSPIAFAYLNYLKKEKQQLIKENFEWLENYS